MRLRRGELLRGGVLAGTISLPFVDFSTHQRWEVAGDISWLDRSLLLSPGTRESYLLRLDDSLFGYVEVVSDSLLRGTSELWSQQTA